MATAASRVRAGHPTDAQSRARALSLLTELTGLLSAMPASSNYVQATRAMIQRRLASCRAPLLESERPEATCEQLAGVIEDEIALVRDVVSGWKQT